MFALDATGPGPWADVWGALERKGGWVFPAYTPFGCKTAKALRDYNMDGAARARANELIEEDRLYRAAIEAWRADKIPPELDLPPGFKFHRAPFKHQVYGIQLALLSWRKFFLWDMGVGKTATVIETLRILKARGQFRKAVLLLPPVVVPTWHREAMKLSDGEFKLAEWDASSVSAKELRGVGWTNKLPRAGFAPDALIERCKGADIVLLTYPSARIEGVRAAQLNQASAVTRLDYDVIVADESQRLGSAESNQTQAALQMSAVASRRILMSGTAADTPAKLFSQLKFLSPALMPMNQDQFRDMYMEMDLLRPYMIRTFKNLGDLNARVDMVASRLGKKDCLDLPARTTTDVPFDVGSKQRARYNELVENYRASLSVEDDDNFGIVPDVPVAALLRRVDGGTRVNKLRQVLSGFLLPEADKSVCDSCEHLLPCAMQRVKPYTKACKVVKVAPPLVPARDFENPRLVAFRQLLENILEADDTNKVIVWANFKVELDDIEEVCKKDGIGYVRLDGTSMQRIGEYEERFMSDPECRVWIGQSKTGVGITLTSANYTIDYAPSWDWDADQQKRDRNYRAGQTRPVTEYRLVAGETVDEYIYGLLTFKTHVSKNLLDYVACGVCSQRESCSKDGTQPFDKDCIYENSVERPTAKLASLGDDDCDV